MSRHTALYISTMCRRTALHVMFKHLAHRPTSERCAIMQSGGVPALLYPVAPGSSSHRDHKGCLRMKRTGENGKAMVVALMMIRGDLDRSPSLPPAHLRVPVNQIELLHLPVRQQAPALGSHCFTLRTGCRIEEIAILIDDVLYYTLPCIATLVFPEPDKWKKSWETVYRSLMPHRHNIIEDAQRVKSVSELPFSPLPHGNPGPWTAHVVKAISSQFQISPESLPSQLIVQLGICEESWPYIRKTKRTYHQFLPDKKNARKNLFGILFSFEPRRLLPDKHRTQSNSPFFWAHNTNMHAAINILRDEELVRPSKWQLQPLPNRDYTNWNEVWLPPMGFYCRGSLQSHDVAVKAAAQFAGVHSDRPICIGGSARLRQPHCTISRRHVRRHCCFPLL